MASIDVKRSARDVGRLWACEKGDCCRDFLDPAITAESRPRLFNAVVLGCSRGHALEVTAQKCLLFFLSAGQSSDELARRDDRVGEGGAVDRMRGPLAA